MQPRLLSLNFSWKQKLIFITVATIIGLSAVTLSSFLGLSSVTNSFEKQNFAVKYKQNLLEMVNSFQNVNFTANELRSNNLGNLDKSLNALTVHIEYMQNNAQNLEHGEVIAFSNTLSELTKNYIDYRRAWMDNRKILGFTADEGKLVDLINKLSVLEKIPAAMISKPVTDIADQQRKYIITHSAENQKAIDTQLKVLDGLIEKFNWKNYPVGKKIIAYKDTFAEVKDLIAKENNIISSINTTSDMLFKTIKEKSTFLEETIINQAAIEASNASSSALNIIVSVAMVVSLTILLSLGRIAMELNNQLKQMQIFLKGIAKGDFSKKLRVTSNNEDEFNQLRIASNKMVSDISTVIEQVVTSNESLIHAREELGKAVEKLAVTSEDVEKNTQKSTISTQQISTTVSDIAKRSVDVSKLAQIASTGTEEGGKVIESLVSSMVSIITLIEKTHSEVANLAQSGSKMSGIIDVINGLADQINLLALNAAIESARAGEAGRGFSVVADEVRALAQKTVNATSNIGEIIKGFNDQSKRMGNLMEEGIRLASLGQENAKNTKSSFEVIENSIKTVDIEMNQVVSAVEEISLNTDAVAFQIEHIFKQSQSTKDTRLLMEAHTNDVSTQAETLGVLTNRFQL